VWASSRTLVETLKRGYGAIVASHSCRCWSIFALAVSVDRHAQEFGGVHPPPMCTDEQDSDRGEHGGDHAAAVEGSMFVISALMIS
jgi:hypothetical protein